MSGSYKDNTVVQELYTPEQLAQMYPSLWQCMLQFANLSATQERNRIARDLHDSLGHVLTGLNFQLQTALKLCKPDPNQAQEFLTEAHRLVMIATQEVRESVKALRSNVLETQSVETLIESLKIDFHRTTGILPDVEIHLPTPLSSQIVTPLYRIIQEALNNTRKYAKATQVRIHLCATSTGLHLMIQDNGCGFNPKEVLGGYGIQGIKERVAMLQGDLQLDSQPGLGCCITVEIPTKMTQMSKDVVDSQSEIHSSLPQIPISQKLSSVSKKKRVRIGEWHLFNLDQTRDLEYS